LEQILLNSIQTIKSPSSSSTADTSATSEWPRAEAVVDEDRADRRNLVSGLLAIVGSVLSALASHLLKKLAKLRSLRWGGKQTLLPSLHSDST